MGVNIPGVYRASLIHLAVGLVVAAVTSVVFTGFSAGFLAGYLLGFFNLVWLFRIVKKGMTLKPERVMAFVSSRYYARFILTTILIGIIVAKGLLGTAGPPLTGIALSVLVSTGVLIFIAKEEFK